jgi:hypothetical protein
MRSIRLIGAIGAVIYAVGFVLVSSAPGGGDPSESDFEEFYVTDDNTALVIIGMFVLTIGALVMLWFFHVLRTAIGTSEAAFGWGAAALGLALVCAGGAVLSGPSGAVAFSDLEFVGTPVAHALAQAGFATMLVAGALFLGAGVAALSLAGRSTGVLTSWAAIAGLVAAVLQLAAIIWIPHFAIPLWVIATSLAGFRVLDVDRADRVVR